MDLKTSNDSVWPLLLILAFMATRLVARIVLKVFSFLYGSPIFFDSVLLFFFKDEISTWILIRCFSLGLDGSNYPLFLFIKFFTFPSVFDVDKFPLIKDGLFLSFQKLRPVWVKSSKYCATYPYDASLWWFLTIIANFFDSSGHMIN